MHRRGLLKIVVKHHNHNADQKNETCNGHAFLDFDADFSAENSFKNEEENTSAKFKVLTFCLEGKGSFYRVILIMFNQVNQCDLDSDSLGIPDQEYKASFQMPASKFQKICRDLQTLGDTIQISVNKHSIQFAVNGAEGEGQITVLLFTTVSYLQNMLASGLPLWLDC